MSDSSTETAGPDEAGLWLGFDFGLRRIGVAIGNRLLGTARPLGVVDCRGGIPDWRAIERTIAEWHPVGLVVGVPLTDSGEAEAITTHARGFIRALRQRQARPVHPADERHSSLAANRQLASMRASGQKRRRVARGDIDRTAAALILEGWFVHGDLPGEPSTPARADDGIAR